MTSREAALDVIISAKLSPVEHLLLKHFVEGAVDPSLAAHYFSANIHYSDGVKLESSLRNFLHDWESLARRFTAFDAIPSSLDDLIRRRDGPRCTFSKSIHRNPILQVEPAYIIPPSLLYNLEISREDRLFKMLEAFLSPIYIKKLQIQLSGRNESRSEDTSSLPNTLLLTPSMHHAFRAGHVHVTPAPQYSASTAGEQMAERQVKDENRKYLVRTLYPDECSSVSFGDGTELHSVKRFKVSTPDNQMLPPPSSFLFDIHSRVATALHLFFIYDKAKSGWSPPPREFHGSFPPFNLIIYWLWLCVPFVARLWIYHALVRVANPIFPTATSSPLVHRLPFGLIMKRCERSGSNETNALRLVDRYTSIPAPHVFDSGDHNGTTYLIMTHLRGDTVDQVFHLMSYAERDQFADDLKAYVKQLRQIPNHTPYRFGNTIGGPIVDHRLPGGSAGPFHHEEDFNRHLTSHLECMLAEIAGKENVRQDHRSYFTHSDFHCSNLLVDCGRLSGIIDWECAAFMPEYWEFTKAMYTLYKDDGIASMFHLAFGQEYETELETERKLMRYTPFGV